MPVETTYTSLREKLSSFLDQVSDDREIIIVRRRGARDVALVASDELAGWMETAHLLRSPANAKRLIEALEEAAQGTAVPETVGELRGSLGLDTVRK
jgi:antitoxin YefM